MTSVIRTFLLLFISAPFYYTPTLHADEPPLNELQLRAAIVYNLAKYVSWPESSGENRTSFIIGIIGQSRSTSAWSSLNGKVLSGRKIIVRRITDLDELTQTQLVFIESSEKKNIPRILSAIRGYPVLTISGIEGFIRYGGMITLHRIDNRMAFDVNLKNARASRISLSSNILKLAVEVIQ